MSVVAVPLENAHHLQLSIYYGEEAVFVHAARMVRVVLNFVVALLVIDLVV